MSDTEELSPTVIAVRAIKAEAEDAVFDALLDDWDYGNCPGSKLKVGNQEIWLYTREDVRQWIRSAQRARKAGPYTEQETTK